jgi:hypothetical protein
MKNEFKKQDANGNKLEENIGLGLNVNHPDKDLRRELNARQEFLLNKMDKEDLIERAKGYGGVGNYLRLLIKANKK